MTRRHGTKKDTLHLMQTARQQDKIIALKPLARKATTPQKSAARILPFTGFRTN